MNSLPPQEPPPSPAPGALGKRGPKKGQNAEFNRRVKDKSIDPGWYYEVMGRFPPWMTEQDIDNWSNGGHTVVEALLQGQQAPSTAASVVMPLYQPSPAFPTGQFPSVVPGDAPDSHAQRTQAPVARVHAVLNNGPPPWLVGAPSLFRYPSAPRGIASNTNYYLQEHPLFRSGADLNVFFGFDDPIDLYKEMTCRL